MLYPIKLLHKSLDYCLYKVKVRSLFYQWSDETMKGLLKNEWKRKHCGQVFRSTSFNIYMNMYFVMCTNDKELPR